MAGKSLRRRVEDAVAEAIADHDPNQRLPGRDYEDVLYDVADKVFSTITEENRDALDDEDMAYIARKTRKLVAAALDALDPPAPPPKLRYAMFDRVVCNVGGERRWAPGTVMSVLEDDPDDVTGQAKLPYVVKMDPPNGRLISVPKDVYDVCRSEVCFGQRAGALWFTLFCLPQQPAKKSAARRFSVGDRVACAVEDESNDYSAWAAGTVLAVDHSVAEDAAALVPGREWGGAAGCVPYQVGLDAGGKVLAHRDEHWLVRDLALQPEGPRVDAGGAHCSLARTRCLTRLVRRQSAGGDGWEAVDHHTRKRRACAAPDSEEDDE